MTRLPAAERLGNPDAVLNRSDLAELGYERRAIDAIFRGCDVLVLRHLSAARGRRRVRGVPLREAPCEWSTLAPPSGRCP